MGGGLGRDELRERGEGGMEGGSVGGRKEIGWEGGRSEGGRRRLDWEGQRVGGREGWEGDRV